jgi:hypothetical protein
MQLLRSCFKPSFANYTDSFCSNIRERCWITPLQTSSVLFRCVPEYATNASANARCSFPGPEGGVTDPNDRNCITVVESSIGAVEKPAKPNLLFDQLNTARTLWGRWFGDLQRAWWVILACSGGVSLVLGFVWLLGAKLCTALFVWMTVLLTLVLVGFLDGYFYYKAGLISISLPSEISSRLSSATTSATTTLGSYATAASSVQSTVSGYVPQQVSSMSVEQSQTAYEVLAYVFTGVAVILFAMVIAMRKSIATAISVIKMGSMALKANLTLLVLPFATAIVVMGFLLWWVFVAASLVTAGELTAKDVRGDILRGVAYLQGTVSNATSGVNFNTAGINITNLVPDVLSAHTVNDTISVIQDMPLMNYLMIYHGFGLLWVTQFILVRTATVFVTYHPIHQSIRGI